MKQRFGGYSKHEDEGERQWYKEECLKAWDMKCSSCDKVFGYWNDEAAMSNHRSQEQAIFFCLRCRQLAEKEK